MDKKDLFSFFMNIKNKHNDNEIMNIFGENYDICKLDINRIYRYLEKYTKINADVDDAEEKSNDDDFHT